MQPYIPKWWRQLRILPRSQFQAAFSGFYILGKLCGTKRGGNRQSFRGRLRAQIATVVSDLGQCWSTLRYRYNQRPSSSNRGHQQTLGRWRISLNHKGRNGFFEHFVGNLQSLSTRLLSELGFTR